MLRKITNISHFELQDYVIIVTMLSQKLIFDHRGNIHFTYCKALAKEKKLDKSLVNTEKYVYNRCDPWVCVVVVAFIVFMV